MASIAMRRAIPGMQQGEWSEVTAIASRDRKKAEEAARRLGIPKSYGSYEELLADPDVEAVYNPLPNHLHVPWSVKAAEAGKHVLCEKPISTTVAETQNSPGNAEPHWGKDRRSRHGADSSALASHSRADSCWPHWGVAIYCRPIHIFQSRSREHPEYSGIRRGRAAGHRLLSRDACAFYLRPRAISRPGAGGGAIREMKTDRLVSGILDFPSGQCSFTCSTQVSFCQRMQFLGTRGRIEIELPLNPAPEKGEPHLDLRRTGFKRGFDRRSHRAMRPVRDPRRCVLKSHTETRRCSGLARRRDPEFGGAGGHFSLGPIRQLGNASRIVRLTMQRNGQQTLRRSSEAPRTRPSPAPS